MTVTVARVVFGNRFPFFGAGNVSDATGGGGGHVGAWIGKLRSVTVNATAPAAAAFPC